MTVTLTLWTTSSYKLTSIRPNIRLFTIEKSPFRRKTRATQIESANTPMKNNDLPIDTIFFYVSIEGETVKIGCFEWFAKNNYVLIVCTSFLYGISRIVRGRKVEKFWCILHLFVVYIRNI